MKQKQIVEYALVQGGSIYVEEELAEGGRIAKTGELRKSEQKFEEVIGKIKPAAQALLNTIRELDTDEINIEFGLKFNINTGIVFASADTETSFKIALKWKRQNND